MISYFGPYSGVHKAFNEDNKEKRSTETIKHMFIHKNLVLSFRPYK